MPKSLTPTKYSALLKDITAIYTLSRSDANRALNPILTRAYWEIGKRIVTVEQDNQIRAEYGKRLLEKLSADLTQQHGNGFSLRNLQYVRKFFLAYPSLPSLISQPVAKLGWAKQCILLSIDDEKLRREYEQKALQENWPKRKLIAELKKVKAVGGESLPAPKDKPRKGIKLSTVRGKIGVYRVVQMKGLHFKEARPALDLGFNVYHTQAAGIDGYQHGEVVELEKPLKGFGVKTVASSAGKRPDRSLLYTYKAYSESVIDGDTLWMNIECGFDLYVRQKLRLRGIDTPEASTPRGRTVQGFLKRTLDAVAFAVIKTYGSDKYDRYLADIFYLPGETDPAVVARDGIYLNQEMLDQGLADLYIGEG
jgi:endonuclease YncB( thermonuclease family)